MLSDVKVSVVMITYNHEDFIREAIEGVLKQKTSFPYELIISEDNSSDKTREICEEYSRQYPNIINLLSTEENLGVMPNFLRVLQEAKSKYIAICEGDDYWLAPKKLQRQFDLLEANNTFSICAHRTYVKQGNAPLYLKETPKENLITYTLKDFIRETKVGSATCSLFFRNKINFSDSYIQKIFLKSPGGDWLVCLLCLLKGNMGLIPEKLAVYRATENGAYSGQSDFNQLKIKVQMSHSADLILNHKYHKELRNFYMREVFLRYNDNTISYEQFHELFLIREKRKFIITFVNICFKLIPRTFVNKYLSKLIYFKTWV